VESDDPLVVISRYSEGAFGLGACAEDPRSAIAQWLAGHEAWIDSIGAHNLHAARLGFLAYIEVTFGDPQRAYDLATEAHALSDSLGMDDRTLTIQVDRVRAQFLGAREPTDPNSDLQQVLREASKRRLGICVRFALDVASRMLDGKADDRVTRLCDEFGYVALPWGSRGDPSPPEVDAARVEQSHGGLSVYDVADLAGRALDELR